MERYLTLDTAYWDPRVLDAAAWLNQEQAAAGRPERVLVIYFYMFDPFVQDIGGWCGGWSPAVVRQIEDAGYIAMPIVTMRPAVAGGMLTPDEIANALTKYPLGARPVHIKVAEDQEDGSFTGAAWSQALGAAMPTELYGLASTILSAYSSGISAIWVGNYPGIGVLPPPDLAHIPGIPDSAWPNDRAWQYVGSASIAGADVDISVSNIALDGAGGNDVSKQDAIDALQDQWGKSYGIGGSPTAFQDGPAAMLDGVRHSALMIDVVVGHLPNIEGNIQRAVDLINGAGGHPADAALMQILNEMRATVTSVQTDVAAVRATTDRDLK